MLKQRCPQIVRGLVIPTRKSGDDQKVERQANASLSERADWVRHHITKDELRQSQLPDVVQGGRRASVKPHSWYARPDHLQTMLDMARPVMDKDNATMKWARDASKWLDDLRPIDLIETDDGAARVFAYIEDVCTHPLIVSVQIDAKFMTLAPLHGKACFQLSGPLQKLVAY